MVQSDGWQTPYDPQNPNDPRNSNVPQQPGRPEQLSGQLQPYMTGQQPSQVVPQHQYVYTVTPPPPPKNDLGVWSLVTGILSWILCPVILGIVAIATGNASKRAVRQGQANNPGMATAGLILGWINVGLIGGFFLVWIVIAFIAFLGAGIAVSQQ